MKSLLEVFLGDAGERVRRLRDGLADETRAADVSAALARDAHTLRGSAATVGLLHLASRAQALESALGRGETGDARAEVDAIAAELAADEDIRTVLCIEDDPANLRLIEHIAARVPGVRLVTATNATRGIEVAEQQRPDLVLLDLVLPDVAGEEVLRRLRRDARTRDVPVVIATASTQPERAQELLELGASEFLLKPLDVDHVIALMRGDS